MTKAKRKPYKIVPAMRGFLHFYCRDCREFSFRYLNTEHCPHCKSTNIIKNKHLSQLKEEVG